MKEDMKKISRELNICSVRVVATCMAKVGILPNWKELAAHTSQQLRQGYCVCFRER